MAAIDINQELEELIDTSEPGELWQLVMRALAKHSVKGNASAGKVFLDELQKPKTEEKLVADPLSHLSGAEVIECIEKELKEFRVEMQQDAEEYDKKNELPDCS